MIIIVNKSLYINYNDNSYSSCKDMFIKKKSNIIKIYTFYLIFLIIFTSYQFNILSNADNTEKETTFYFKDVLDLEGDIEYDSTFGMSVLISQEAPTKENDSIYPPNLFNGFKLNYEEWLNWFTTTWMFYFLNDSLYGEYSDFLEGLDLIFPNPFRIVETYEYDGEEPIEINGDVDFDLYFSTTSKYSINDNVKVALYSMNPLLPFPKELGNETVEINSENLISGIKYQKITLKQINFTLNPGNSLLFQVEIIPSNKSIMNFLIKDRPILQEFGSRVINLILNIVNNSNNPTLQEIDELINEIKILIDELERSEEIDITREDIAEIFNSMISSSLIYDSFYHPSSVTIPMELSYEDENIIRYYLHEGNNMDNKKPINENPVETVLSNECSIHYKFSTFLCHIFCFELLCRLH